MKLKGILLSILIISFIGALIILIIYINSNKKEEKYFSILESKSYIFEENRKMNVDVYSTIDNSIIEDINSSNYELNIGNNKYMVTDIEIQKYEINNYYLYHFIFDIPQVNSEVCGNSKFKISNLRFKLNIDIGYISILNPNGYKLLSFDKLYASYSNINGSKHFIGLNIELNYIDQYIEALKLSNNVVASLKAAKPKLYENEIDIYDVIKGYNINKIEANSNLIINNKAFFIPFAYNDLYLVKEGYIAFVIDGINYYIDTFMFFVGNVDPNDYLSLKKEGYYD